MGRELELKFRATEAQQQALQNAFENFVTIRMETTYFDTPTGALADHHVTLRLRNENNICVCTMKTPLSDGSRGEWECQAEDISQGLNTLLTLGAPESLCLLALQGVQPVCGAKFTRLAAKISTGDGFAELALDQGVLLGGGQQLPLCEIELEHKEGSEKATIAMAKALAAQYGLQTETKSKFRRAIDLAKGE
jgi:inorganic triphosphatase YgiF